MDSRKVRLTEVLLVVLILVTALGIMQNMSKPLSGTLPIPMSAVAPYQGNAADGVTTTGNAYLQGGKDPGGLARSIRTDTSGRIVVMPGEPPTVTLAAGDPLPVTMTMPVAVIQSDADLLKADANAQQGGIDVGIGNPLYVTPTQRLFVTVDDVQTGTVTVDIDSKHLDESGGAIQVVEIEHFRVHEGQMYEASYTASSLADEATQYIWLRTGANMVHFAFAVAGGGQIDVSMWETPTVTGGTVITLVNMKRDSPMAATMVISHSPSVSAQGSAIFENILIPGGAGPQASARVGGSARNAAEWLFDVFTSYLVGVKNESGGAISVTWQTNFYEE